MVNSEVRRTPISILRRTKGDLDSLKHPGQSYDGLIQELIELWKKEHGVAERVSITKTKE